jgi:hypothetical protein
MQVHLEVPPDWWHSLSVIRSRSAALQLSHPLNGNNWVPSQSRKRIDESPKSAKRLSHKALIAGDVSPCKLTQSDDMCVEILPATFSGNISCA